MYQLRLLWLALLQTSSAATQPKRWYDGLPNVKVLHPEDDNRAVVDEIFRIQNNSHFGTHRYAILLTPGEYPGNFGIRVSYYTSVIGVGAGPTDVQVKWVESPNGLNGHATNNFWRSVEGVTLWGKEITWAVSQAAPIRRAVVKNDLRLSYNMRYSSGGFMSDVAVHGDLSMGTQQQWFFRNVDLWGKMGCPSGWNYVFVGLRGLSLSAQQACSDKTPGKVVSVPQPFVAEKPFLVAESRDDWYIHVPKFVSNVVGATASIIQFKLSLEHDVFITEPGMTSSDINKGMEGKKGLLVTPGIYELKVPIKIKEDGFVVLGIGWPTLIATDGRPAVQVEDGLREVRVAGLLLEAGTPQSGKPTEPLLLWGTKAKKEYTPPHGASGLASDVFVRVGAFRYRGCTPVRADTMMEINSDDVVLDHVWLWHADHDDCGTDLENSGPSDRCHSTNGLVVNGRRVTSYGLAAEHTVNGHMLKWEGEEGDVYFYQSEVPYHQSDWGKKGYAGYYVAPHVKRHTAHGVGVYIISSMLQGKVRSAFMLPQYAKVYNLFNVTIGGHNQFGSLACSHGGACFGPEKCTPMRCWRSSFPHAKLPVARVQAFEQLEDTTRLDDLAVQAHPSAISDEQGLRLMLTVGLPSLCAVAGSVFALHTFLRHRRRTRHSSLLPSDEGEGTGEPAA